MNETIQYEMTPDLAEELFRANNSTFASKKYWKAWRRILFFPALAGAVLIGVDKVHFGWNSPGVFIGFIILGFTGYIAAALFILRNRVFRTGLKDVRGLVAALEHKMCTISLTDEDITEHFGFSTTRVPWSKFTTINETSEFLILSFSNYQSKSWLPKRFFRSEQLDFIRSKVSQTS